jgi:hypothetical protein
MKHALKTSAAASLAALLLAGCDTGSEPAPVGPDMELAEDVDQEGTVTEQMDSGAPPIREGGGRATGTADNPNEPAVPDNAPIPEESEAAEVR